VLRNICFISTQSLCVNLKKSLLFYCLNWQHGAFFFFWPVIYKIYNSNTFIQKQIQIPLPFNVIHQFLLSISAGHYTIGYINWYAEASNLSRNILVCLVNVYCHYCVRCHFFSPWNYSFIYSQITLLFVVLISKLCWILLKPYGL